MQTELREKRSERQNGEATPQQTQLPFKKKKVKEDEDEDEDVDDRGE